MASSQKGAQGSTGRPLSTAGDPLAPMGLPEGAPAGKGTQPRRGARDRWDLGPGKPDETGTWTS